MSAQTQGTAQTQCTGQTQGIGQRRRDPKGSSFPGAGLGQAAALTACLGHQPPCSPPAGSGRGQGCSSRAGGGAWQEAPSAPALTSPRGGSPSYSSTQGWLGSGPSGDGPGIGGARGQGLSWEPYKGPCSPSPDSTPTLPVPHRCPPHAHLDKPSSVLPWLKRPVQASDPPSPATLTPGLPLSVEGRVGFPAGDRY